MTTWKFELANWNTETAREVGRSVRDAQLLAMNTAITPIEDSTFDLVGDALDAFLAALGVAETTEVYVNVQSSVQGEEMMLSFNLHFTPPPLVAGVKATAELSFTGAALTDGDTVTIGTRTYTFKTLLTGAPDEVLIGAVTDSLANLKSAVNGTAGEGTTYGAGTVSHASVEATTLTGTTALSFRARVAGETGNTIAKSEASSNLSWDVGATFEGGTNPA